MQTATEAIAGLRQWILTCGIPRKRLARMAHLADGALWSADTADWNPRADTVRKLEELRGRLAAQDVVAA